MPTRVMLRLTPHLAAKNTEGATKALSLCALCAFCGSIQSPACRPTTMNPAQRTPRRKPGGWAGRNSCNGRATDQRLSFRSGGEVENDNPRQIALFLGSTIPDPFSWHCSVEASRARFLQCQSYQFPQSLLDANSGDASTNTPLSRKEHRRRHKSPELLRPLRLL